MFAAFLCVAIFIATVLFRQVRRDSILLYVGLSALGVLFVLMMWAQFFGLRCTWCRGNLAPLVFSHLAWSSKRFRYCPYCGRDLDEDVHNAERESAAESW
jgi:hypothetical protein